jgi:hypothetical protein
VCWGLRVLVFWCVVVGSDVSGCFAACSRNPRIEDGGWARIGEDVGFWRRLAVTYWRRLCCSSHHITQ